MAQDGGNRERGDQPLSGSYSLVINIESPQELAKRTSCVTPWLSSLAESGFPSSRLATERA